MKTRMLTNIYFCAVISFKPEKYDWNVDLL